MAATVKPCRSVKISSVGLVESSRRYVMRKGVIKATHLPDHVLFLVCRFNQIFATVLLGNMSHRREHLPKSRLWMLPGYCTATLDERPTVSEKLFERFYDVINVVLVAHGLGPFTK